MDANHPFVSKSQSSQKKIDLQFENYICGALFLGFRIM